MFCPKCNDELVRVNKGLACLKGKMVLSQNFERGLTECFVLKNRKPKEFKFTFLVGGKWFCPGCGLSMKEEVGFIRCSKCSLTLNEFIRPLVELHMHLKEGQKKWDWEQ